MLENDTAIHWLEIRKGESNAFMEDRGSIFASQIRVAYFIW